MTRADLEAAAEEKYGPKTDPTVTKSTDRLRAERRKAYVRGRLDQAEADAQIAEADFSQPTRMRRENYTREDIAAAIRKGVE